MDILKTLEENFFEVELYHDDEKKYRIICTMDFWYSFRDIITGKEIQIRSEDPLSINNRGLTCKNHMHQILSPEVSQVLKEYSEEKIEKYSEYITAIEEKSIRLYDQEKQDLLNNKQKSKKRIKTNFLHKKARTCK